MSPLVQPYVGVSKKDKYMHAIVNYIAIYDRKLTRTPTLLFEIILVLEDCGNYPEGGRGGGVQ